MADKSPLRKRPIKLAISEKVNSFIFKLPKIRFSPGSMAHTD